MAEGFDGDEKPEDWKKELSSVFNENEVFYSLFILVKFYVIYAIGKASFELYDNSANDKERFIQSCFCDSNERSFYRGLFYSCLGLWILLHSYNFLAQLTVRRVSVFADIIKAFLAFCIVFPGFCLYYGVYKGCLSKCQFKPPAEGDAGNVYNQVYDQGKIELFKKNLRLLWFQYCELYVIGYTKYDGKIQPVDSIIRSDHDHETTNDQTHSNSKKFPERYLLKDIIRALFFIVKYISQLVTVPLLLLQIFDMYSFLCFSPDSFCSHTTEHNLQLVQAVITLFFYSSLVISHLASTILLWNPWPKHAKNNDSRPTSQNQSRIQSVNLFNTVRDKFDEIFNDKHPWTIYLLIDLKVVYIITFGLITVVNLISSTANIHASNDKTSMMLFNVSSEYMNVNVTSINDPILWNCRRFSETSNYYKFLYWTVIVVLIVVMGGIFFLKLISLNVVNGGCGFKFCSNMSPAFKMSITQLWYIAIHQKLINKKLPDDNQANDILTMLNESIPDRIVPELSPWNYFRSLIPYILLFLSIIILSLAYFSYDLHPLACISVSDEELIRYDLKVNNVHLTFSNSLISYQKIGGILVLILSFAYLLFVKLFFYCTELVVTGLQQRVEIEIQNLSTNENPGRQQCVEGEIPLISTDENPGHQQRVEIKINNLSTNENPGRQQCVEGEIPLISTDENPGHQQRVEIEIHNLSTNENPGHQQCVEGELPLISIDENPGHQQRVEIEIHNLSTNENPGRQQCVEGEVPLISTDENPGHQQCAEIEMQNLSTNENPGRQQCAEGEIQLPSTDENMGHQQCVEEATQHLSTDENSHFEDTNL